MAKIRYRALEFQPDTLVVIEQMAAILAEYKGRVSVRQLFYRFVVAGLIENTQKQYGRIQDIATKARYAGMIDWDHIEDRNREAQKPQDWPSGRAILESASDSFRLDRWRGQPFYVELWVEKATLAGVLASIPRDFHVTFMANRGYSSASAMKESADRIRFNSREARPVILYVGDHDPSGEDMVRDIGDRLREFGCPPWLDVRKVALTMAQIEQYNPPPNPAKTSDARAAGYIEKHGESSWEVEALPPDDLEEIVTATLISYIDKPKMDAVITEENEIKTRIKLLARQMPAGGSR